MNRYILLYRPEYKKDASHFKWQSQEIEGETPEDAMRSGTLEEVILQAEFVIHKVEETWTSEEFHHDGTFDDIHERYEEEALSNIEPPEGGWPRGSDMDRI